MKTNINHLMSQIVCKRYLLQHDLCLYSSSLIRVAHTFIHFQLDQQKLPKLLSLKSSDYLEVKSDWASQAKMDIFHFLKGFVLSVDIWSLQDIFPQSSIHDIFFLEKEKSASFNKDIDLTEAIKVFVNEKILKLQIENAKKLREQTQLMIEVARSGVTCKFLKAMFRLSDDQVSALKKFSTPNAGGQKKITEHSRDQIILSWKNDTEEHKLKRFNNVVQKTGFSTVIVSRVITPMI